MIDSKLYTNVARYRCGLFRHIDILYCPSCAAFWAIREKDTIRYFRNLDDCLDYAVESKMIKATDRPKIRAELADQERQVDDRYFGRPEYPEMMSTEYVHR